MGSHALLQVANCPIGVRPATRTFRQDNPPSARHVSHFIIRLIAERVVDIAVVDLAKLNVYSQQSIIAESLDVEWDRGVGNVFFGNVSHKSVSVHRPFGQQ
jgi:hypothetical protein